MTDTGWLPPMGFELNGPRLNLTLVNEFRKQTASSILEAQATLVKVKEEYKQYYDC